MEVSCTIIVGGSALAFAAMDDRSGGFLDRLEDDERRRVLAEAQRRKFKRGEVIFHEGDPGTTLHLIDKGHVAIRTTTLMGEVVTLTVLGPGDVFGEQALLDPDNIRTASAVAVELAETRSIRRDDFERLRKEHPSVDRFLVELLAAQVRRLSAHLQEALYVPAEQRLLRRLLDVAESYTDSSGACTVPLTQDDLATMAGTTRPTANRLLKAIESDGVVSISRGRIDVLDIETLKRKSR